MLEKPAGKWCQHCKPGAGCTIYESRPDPCREFECLWLVDSAGLLPEEARPDRSKLMFDIQQGGDSGLRQFVRAFELAPGAAQKPAGRRLIDAIRRRGQLIATFPPNQTPGLLIFPPGQLQHVREQGLREGAITATRDPDVYRCTHKFSDPDQD
ncbi:MAG: hypothetical protein AAGE01_09840 [Pseudomonadota bacterium]